MRLFIALDVPSKVQKYLETIQSKLQINGLSIAKHPHMTLKFLGEVKEENLNDINSALQEISFSPFELTLSEFGFFPSSSKPRVIFIGSIENEQLSELQKNISQSLPSFPDDHSFHPHFTIARVKEFANKAEIKEAVNGIKINPISFNISEFKLKKSVLTPNGPVYSDLFIYSAKDL
ncbi:MAG: RNA 2',3'-cyclic phosphodiesterase [Nanoarchaeota archaeon]